MSRCLRVCARAKLSRSPDSRLRPKQSQATTKTYPEPTHEPAWARSQTNSRLSLEIFRFGSAIAAKEGLILADTKFEFGERDRQVILIDEVMTPDSSRFWARDTYRAGTTPPSFDKQPLRDYLQNLRDKGEWNGEAPGPHIPDDVVLAMSNRYLEAFRRITGESLQLGDNS